MGLAPHEIDAMGIWQFVAAADGYKHANSPPEAQGPITPTDMMIGLREAQTMGTA